MDGLVGTTLFESGPADASNSEPDEQLQRGGTLSRYLLVERIGAGGMGVVWAAYDPELDRRVAIKLLRPRRSASGRAQEARTRLVREAQAMARLAHPNVISVHDVGEHGGQVFVAMEFVDGDTLGDWVGRRGRAWAEIIEIFVQAGRGLAAAHGVGLIHRDFKPDNVLIGRDGRARVTDFGLARSLESETLDDEHEHELELEGQTARRDETLALGSTPALATTLTRTGVLLGTPAYMAPEQFSSGRLDARSDQFAFCVALWEALYGQRPFSGRTLIELSAAVTEGALREPPSEARVPGFINRALRRGLAVDPAQRWPSMDLLLRELERDPTLERRRWLAGGAMLGLVIGLSTLAPLLAPQPEPAPELCPAADARLRDVWDPRRRAKVEAAIQRGASTYSDDGLELGAKVLAELDSYSAAWLAMHQDACAATHLRNEQSPELLDRRMRCLDERRAELSAAVELLATGEARAVDNPMKLLAALAPIEPCGKRSYLDARLPIPADPVLAQRVAELRAREVEAKTRAHLGDNEGLTALRELLAEAEALNYPPLRAELLVTLGRIESSYEAPSDVRERLELGVVESIRTGQDDYAARAASELIFIVGERLSDPDEGLRWAQRVHAWHDHLDADPKLRAATRVAESLVLASVGQMEESRSGLHEALALLGVDDELHGLDALDSGQSFVASVALNGLAVFTFNKGDFRGARELMQKVRDVRLRLFTPSHPQVLLMKINLAAIDFMLGDWAASQLALEGVLPDLRARAAAQPFHLTLALLNLSEVHIGRYELLGEAELERSAALIAKARAGYEANFAPTHVRWSEILTIGARFDRLRGDLEAADLQLERGLQIGADGGTKPNIAQRAALKLELGLVRVEQGRHEQALALFDETLALITSDGHRAQPVSAVALTGGARALLALDRADEARAQLHEALGIWDQLAPSGHPMAAVTLDLLARIDKDGAHHRTRAQAIRARLR